MEKLDIKDRKILYHLNIDSRQSFRSIGRKVGLSKDIVASRVKKLQERGIIKNFSTHFDYLRLGYTCLRFYLKFQYLTPEIKNEIIDYFVKCKYSIIIASVEGSYDFVVIMLVKNTTDIYPFWQKTLDKYGDYFAERFYSNYVGESIYKTSFLIDEEDNRTKYIQKRNIERVEYDDLDFKILKQLTINSRKPTIEIAKELKTTTSTINKRIKRLVDTGLILGFWISIDWDKLGYYWFKLDLFLKEYNKKYQIIKYIEKNPHLLAVDHTIDYADLEMEFLLNNLNHLHQIIEDISIKFPKIIRNYKYVHVQKHHKFFILDMEKK